MAQFTCTECGNDLTPAEDQFVPVECPNCGISQIRPFQLGQVRFDSPVADSSLFRVYHSYDVEHKLFMTTTVLRQDIPNYELNLAIAKEGASNLSILKHLNLCPIFSCAEEEGHFFVNCPRMDGYALSDYKGRRR